MKQFTVLFSHDLPIGGIAQYLCVIESAETPEKAADQCVKGVGGFATVIAVFDGVHIPILKAGNCSVFDDLVPYKTKKV